MYLARIALTEGVLFPVVIVEQVAQCFHRLDTRLALAEDASAGGIRPAVLRVIPRSALQTASQRRARVDIYGLEVGHIIRRPITVRQQNLRQIF